MVVDMSRDQDDNIAAVIGEAYSGWFLTSRPQPQGSCRCTSLTTLQTTTIHSAIPTPTPSPSLLNIKANAVQLSGRYPCEDSSGVLSESRPSNRVLPADAQRLDLTSGLFFSLRCTCENLPSVSHALLAASARTAANPCTVPKLPLPSCQFNGSACSCHQHELTKILLTIGRMFSKGGHL